jgi:outer membrane immunogenic protein
MFKKFFLTTVAALCVSGSAVMAADAIDEIPAAPTAVSTPAFSWAGGYIGAHGGYGWLKGTLSQGSVSIDDDYNGGRIGAFAGWNFDVGHNVILGVEGDVNYDWNEIEYSNFKAGTDVSGSVRARAGYAIDHALLFVAGGWTAQRGYIDYAGDKYKDTSNGWTVGAGVDYALTKNIFTRAEYRYNDFGDQNIEGINFDTKQHVINIGVGVKF